jgi:hypothetical protein
MVGGEEQKYYLHKQPNRGIDYNAPVMTPGPQFKN